MTRDCCKRTYPTAARAEREAERLRSLPGQHRPRYLRPYWCGACRGWHVGHGTAINAGRTVKPAWLLRYEEAMRL